MRLRHHYFEGFEQLSTDKDLLHSFVRKESIPNRTLEFFNRNTTKAGNIAPRKTVC